MRKIVSCNFHVKTGGIKADSQHNQNCKTEEIAED